MEKFLKIILRKIGFEIKRYSSGFNNKVVCLKTGKKKRGNALISYIIEPFLAKTEEAVLNRHNHFGRSLQMANVLLQHGYDVDVIDYKNTFFYPQKSYEIFIDVRNNLERLSSIINSSCIKIYFIDTAHILYHCHAELKRLLNLQSRKGVTLRPKRLEMPNMAIEYADFAISHGSEFTINTFKYAKKPIYKICQYHHNTLPYPENKDVKKNRGNFLWFGSGGFVHKGLDLVLDAFSEMPGLQLFICGPIEQENEFVKIYGQELYRTKNIHTIGWVDITSQKFREITANCIGMVYPSCSEGGAGCVTQSMHAGLIPIVSYESGIEVNDFGIIINDCSVESIKRSVQMVSSLPADILEIKSRQAWNYAVKNHNRERFAHEFANIIKKAVA
jgi:glycosyltransferase involved in cell wall biosynthesis